MPPVMALGDTCPHCHRPLIEIDYYGERLIGCIECNRWSWRGSDNPSWHPTASPWRARGTVSP